MGLVELIRQSERMPIRKRFWRAYLPRWREILRIVRMAAGRARGAPLRVQELQLLRSSPP